jgi:hypothetical protein
MNKNPSQISVFFTALLVLFAIANIALADTVTGDLSTDVGSNTVSGVVVSAPIANPPAGAYASTQNVTLTADGASSIDYTIDGTTPTCSTGNTYSIPISVSSSEPIEVISCYPDNVSSTVASYLYTINIPSNVGNTASSVSTSGGSFSSGGEYSNSESIPGVGISDFVLLMANWGQPGTGNPADFSGDAIVGIQDFVWLMANWTI